MQWLTFKKGLAIYLIVVSAGVFMLVGLSASIRAQESGGDAGGDGGGGGTSGATPQDGQRVVDSLDNLRGVIRGGQLGTLISLSYILSQRVFGGRILIIEECECYNIKWGELMVIGPPVPAVVIWTELAVSVITDLYTLGTEYEFRPYGVGDWALGTTREGFFGAPIPIQCAFEASGYCITTAIGTAIQIIGTSGVPGDGGGGGFLRGFIEGFAGGAAGPSDTE